MSMGRYDDMINMEHHVSTRHPQMSVLDRAAQFAPFAALTGLDDAVDETARLTEEKIELTDIERDRVNRGLNQLYELLQAVGRTADESERPAVQLVYFHRDPLKDGGAYLPAVGRARRMDPLKELLILEDGTEISYDDIYDLSVNGADGL